MAEIINIMGNDASDSGVVEVRYSHGAHSPLGFEFKRKDGFRQSFSIHAGQVRELIKFLVENL